MPFNTDPSPHLRDYYQKTTDWATSLRAQYDEDEKKEAHWIAQKVAVSNQREKADSGVAALAMVNKVLDTTPAVIQWRNQVAKKSEEKVHMKLASFTMSQEDRNAFNEQWEKSQKEDIRFNKATSTIKDDALREYIQSLNPGKIKHAKSYFAKVKAENLNLILEDALKTNAPNASGVTLQEEYEERKRAGSVAFADWVTDWAGEQFVEGSLSKGLISKHVMPKINEFVKTQAHKNTKAAKDQIDKDNVTEVDQTLEMSLGYEPNLDDGKGGQINDPNSSLKAINFATENLASKILPEDVPDGLTANQYAGKIIWGRVFKRAEEGLISNAEKTKILSGLVAHPAGKEDLNGEKVTGPALLLKNAGYSISDFEDAVERGQRASLSTQVEEKHAQGKKLADGLLLKCSKEGCSADEVNTMIEGLKTNYAGYNNEDLNRLKGGGNDDAELYKSLNIKYETAIKTGSIEKWTDKQIEERSEGNIRFANEIRKKISLIKTRKLDLDFTETSVDNMVNEGGKFLAGQAILTTNGILVANDVKKVLNEAFIANIIADPTDPDAFTKALIKAEDYFRRNGGGKGNEIKGKFSSGAGDDYEIYNKMNRQRLGIADEVSKVANDTTKAEWKSSLYTNGKLNKPNTFGQLTVEDFVGIRENGGYTQEVLIKAREYGLRPGEYVKLQYETLINYSKDNIELQNDLRLHNLQESEGGVGFAENIPGLNDEQEALAWTAAKGNPDLLYALKFTDPTNFSPILKERLDILITGYDKQIKADKEAAEKEAAIIAAEAEEEAQLLRDRNDIINAKKAQEQLQSGAAALGLNVDPEALVEAADNVSQYHIGN